LKKSKKHAGERSKMPSPFYVIDFETTGFNPQLSDRAIEVAVVKVIDGEIEDHFQSLLNPHRHVPYGITDFTGISQEMVDGAPSSSSVMTKLKRYIGKSPLIAHNAPFDRRFFRKEMELAGLNPVNDFLCTIRLARKAYPEAPKYSLSSLVEYIGIDSPESYHRALADATATSNLFIKIQHIIENDYFKPAASFEDLEAFLSS
jgi:DNA polymerase-3 subunit epsilon